MKFEFDPSSSVKIENGKSSYEIPEQPTLVALSVKLLHERISESSDYEVNQSQIGVLEGVFFSYFDGGNDVYSIENVFDDHSQQCDEFYFALFKDGRLKEEYAQQLGPYSNVNQIAYIESVTIDASHRGKGLGLYLLGEAVRLIHNCCGSGTLIVCKPAPAEPCPEGFDRGQRKLQKYWSKLGFQPFKQTGYFWLDTDSKGPTVKSLNRLFKQRKAGKVSL